MSRVDRYKHLHGEGETSEAKKTFNPRKEKVKNHAEQQNDFFEKDKHRHEQLVLETPQNRKVQKIKKQKPPKRRKKFSWIKKIFLVFILLLVLAIGLFFKGKKFAENDPSLPEEATETFNGVKSANGAHNILILGSDTRGEDSGRADTIMVLQLDGPSKKTKLISFMRDTFVDIPGLDPNKINSAYAYGGAELVRETLVENFNIDCQYYAKVDFQSFEKIIDAMFSNGIQIDAEKDINLDGVDITKGVQKMDGHVLLQYARFRMDEEGDFGRVRRQQQVMSAVMSQLKNPLTMIRTPEALGRFVGYISTDIPTSFMIKNGPSLVLNRSKGIDRLTVPVENSWNYVDYDYAGSVLQIDFEQNQSAIENFLN